MSERLVTIDEIAEARKRLPSVVVRTPLLLSEALSERTGKRAYFKCENLQVFSQQLQMRKALAIR